MVLPPNVFESYLVSSCRMPPRWWVSLEVTVLSRADGIQRKRLGTGARSTCHDDVDGGGGGSGDDGYGVVIVVGARG